MFELFYKAGKSFADSFFIGREGKDNVVTISASEVLPLEMQKKIQAAEEEINKVEVENTVEGTPATEDKAIENLNEAEVKLDSVK
uniref:hypothetical protein n=1 Tax=Candidatus Ruminimicrobium bovinum TaxID=3242779 RepID=UPI0039B85107